MMQNTCDILVTNAAGVVIPKVGIVQTDVMIENGKIKALRKSTHGVQASRKINAEGKYVLPGIIDPHVHYGVYTPIEDAAKTESKSAAIGGVTTMMRMLRVYERHENIEKHLRASKYTHHVDYSIHASILRSNQIKDIRYLKKKFGNQNSAVTFIYYYLFSTCLIPSSIKIYTFQRFTGIQPRISTNIQK